MQTQPLLRLRGPGPTRLRTESLFQYTVYRKLSRVYPFTHHPMGNVGALQQRKRPREAATGGGLRFESFSAIMRAPEPDASPGKPEEARKHPVPEAFGRACEDGAFPLPRPKSGVLEKRRTFYHER